MKKYFFISSALDEDTAAVRRFHADLEDELRAKAGAHVGGVLSTRAGLHTKAGDTYGIAATELPVMVALCSDRYFEDGWCGLEWAIVTARADGPTGKDAGNLPESTGHWTKSGASEARPASRIGAGLVPVLWRPLTKRVPQGVADPFEGMAHEFGELYAQRGLLALLRSNAVGDGGYFAVVRTIATKVIAAQQIERATFPANAVSTLPPAFGKESVARSVTGPALRTPSSRHPTPSSTRITRGRPSHIAISYVGADQEWADWMQSLVTRDGHTVTQVRWNPTRGERLAATVEQIRRKNADLVLVVLSRRYRAPYPEQPGSAALEQWEILGDGGPLGKVIRVLVDHEPLPEPLRSSDSATVDLSEFDLGQVRRLLDAAGLGHTPVSVNPQRPSSRRPGDAPPVWNVPAENEFFTGRDDELAQIRSLLTRHGRVALTAENGLPNMGETEVAIEYSHRFKLRYDAVWWVSCDPPEHIRSQLDQFTRRSGELAGTLHGTGPVPRRTPGWSQAARSAGPSASFGELWTGVTGSGRPGSAPEPNSLVVFDGVVDPAGISEFVAEQRGHVLAVADTVGGNWDGGIVTLGRLRRAESVLLLKDAATMVDPGMAALIAEALGDRPGLVAETARYLVRQNVSPEVCLRLLTIRTSESRPRAPSAGGSEQSGSSAQLDATTQASERAGTGKVPAAGLTGGTATSRTRLTARDIDNLRAELMRVDYINDPTNFQQWLAALETFLGRRPEIPESAVLSSRLMSVLVEAASQAGPGMLDAIARALEAVAPNDRSVSRFRVLIAMLSDRWNETPQRSSDDLRPSETPGARTPTAPPPAEDIDAPYYFFTSYARRGDRRLVQQFHEQFQAELERKARRSVNCAGFLDHLSMEGGAHWRVELRQALRSSPIMLALWSDDYFDSLWCGREFAVFQERIRRATTPGGAPPACILPLPWLRLQEEIPPPAGTLQIVSMDLGKFYDQMPLVDLMRQHPRLFQKYLIKLVDRVMAVTRHPLPSLDEQTADEIQPAFGWQP